ncbi:hypothetical protein BKH20_01910 [Actinomyces oris]|uniref:Uncharacterized protein n=1 Tax=Actinomyces oris TaxID=544580 RepID=A0A1Q8WWV9_9ACTO|nr:hypothetical protein BKH20_01910 [Actinomyces oris]
MATVYGCCGCAPLSGAALLEPIVAFVSRNRFVSISVPVGVRWAVMPRVEDPFEEESSAVDAWAKEQACGQEWNGRC